MGDKVNRIYLYILGLVTSLLPKNEEIIHSGLFLVLSKEENLKIPDWYYNGYSVISETVSSCLQALCKNRTVTFTNDGLYSIVENQSKIPMNDLEQVHQYIEKMLPNYGSGLQIVKEAKRRFQLKNVGATS